MMNLALHETPAILPAATLDQLRDFDRGAEASNTLRGYASDFRIFADFCHARDLSPLPASPDALRLFIAAQTGYGVAAATLARRLAAISYAHRARNLPSPVDESVRRTHRAARRRLGAAQSPKAPLTNLDLRVVLSRMRGDSLVERRDRAILLFGFASAMRRAEIAALRVEDLEETPEGMRVRIRRSKTDQEGQGATIAIIRGRGATCPVMAIRAWLDAAAITAGPLFRRILKDGATVGHEALNPYSIASIIKARAAAAGLDARSISAHSLRAGFITSALVASATLPKVSQHARHKNPRTTMRYFRDEIFANHAGAGLL